jgi:hypothetical protein
MQYSLPGGNITEGESHIIGELVMSYELLFSVLQFEFL